jgi:hypothetical protein
MLMKAGLFGEQGGEDGVFVLLPGRKKRDG